MDPKFSDQQIYVSIDGVDSPHYDIKTGVPQGSILSPILFSIFINDIPLSLEKYSKVVGALYADDLFAFYSDKNLNRIQIVLQKYLNNLELWLRKWRLKVAPHKCSYNIYYPGFVGKKLSLKIFGKEISKVNNTRYLGVLLDSRLSYNTHIKALKDKCFRKMNFLRILKHSKILNKTKVMVYNAMVRSNIDFAAPLYGKLSRANKTKFNSIQYNSLKIILNKREQTSHTEMIKEANIKNIFDHLDELRKRYIGKALSNNQMIIDLKKEVDAFIDNNPTIQKEKVSLFH